MPMAIPIIIGIAAAAGAYAAGATLATAVIVGMIVAAGTALMSTPTAGIQQPKVPNSVYKTDPTQLSFQGDVPRRLVYGRPRVAGVVVYANTAGENHEQAILVVAIAAHQIVAVDDIWIDQKEGALYGAFLEVEYHLGSDDQAASTRMMQLIPQWTLNHRLRGIAYAVVIMTYDKVVWKDGFPKNIQFDVRGKPVYDPRTQTTNWSCNPALNLNDYLLSSNGLSATVDDVSQVHLINAANRCDEKPPIGSSSVCDGRYTCNGVIELTTTKEDIINLFATAMAGCVVWAEGKYEIYAGSKCPVVGQITQDQLSGIPNITPQSPTDQTFNTIKGTFLDALNQWTFSDFPPVSGANYVAEDGEELIRDIQLPLTTSALTSQRIATIYLRRERLDGTITLPCDWSVYGYKVMDVVELSLNFLGWVNMLYQVTSWEFRLPTQKDAGGVNLSLREYNDDIYDDDMTLLPDVGGGIIAKPDVTTVSTVKGLTLQSDEYTLDPITQTPRIKASWQQHANPFVTGYDVYIRKSGETAEPWTFLPSVTTTSVYFPAVNGYRYEVAIRAVSIYATKSDMVSSSIIANGSFYFVPGDVTMITYTLSGNDGASPELQPYVNLSWSIVTGADGYILTFTTLDGVSTEIARLPSGTNTFLQRRYHIDGVYSVVALSPSGSVSANAATVAVPATSAPVAYIVKANTIYDYDLVGLVPHLNSQLVPQSTQLAKDGGWDTFDIIVPNPVISCSMWSKQTVWAGAGTYRADGILGYRSLDRIPVSFRPKAFDGTNEYSGQFTVGSSGVNVKCGASFLPSKGLFIITIPNTYVESLA